MYSARKQVEPVSGSHDRWLVSYADFITLLFALFVVLFASSQTDMGRTRAWSRSVSQAFDGHSAERAKHDAKTELMKTSEALVSALAEEIGSGEIRIAMEPRGLVISLQESGFFPSGGDTLLSGAVPSMEKLASIIRKLPNPIRLEGHTDARPISNSRFHNNWELSAARGIAVLQSFQQRHGIPPERLAVVAYADTKPKATNDTDEGRATNRRVDVTILNEGALKQEASIPGRGPQRASPVGEVNRDRQH
jgi:chemotaxis protein MotB